MDTDALIDALARDAKRIRPGAAGRGLGLAFVVGAAAALLLQAGGLGLRPDLSAAITTFSFWAKEAWALSIAGGGFFLTARLARPDSSRIGAIAALIPFALILVISGVEWTQAPPADRMALISEQGWACSLLILGLSVPIFLALLSALGRMAPTRLMAAGAAAGLAASALAASIYALGCEATSPTYLFTRYGLSIAMATALGAMLGRRMLRW